MRLIYENELFILDNNVTVVINEIYTKVNKIKENKNGNLVLSHLVIDGVEVYENYETYIREHLDEITTIQVATRNINEMIYETMVSIHSYLKRAIPALSELVDSSYENYSSKLWDGIHQLAEGMQWILHFMGVTKSALHKPFNWEEIEKNIQQCEVNFAQLIEAVETKDIILICDILSYEITPAYETLEKSLAVSIDNEEFLKDVN